MNGQETSGKLSHADLRFLDSCRRFELKCGELYHHFERLFAGEEWFSQLWKKTAREEENHAQQFDLALRLKGAGMERVKTDVDKAATDLVKLDAFLDKVLASKPSSQRALELAIRLEEQLAVVHMASIVAFNDPEMKKLFDAMMENDRDHVSALREALNRLKH